MAVLASAANRRRGVVPPYGPATVLAREPARRSLADETPDTWNERLSVGQISLFD